MSLIQIRLQVCLSFRYLFQSYTLFQIELFLLKDGCEEFDSKLKDCSCKREIKIKQSSGPNISGNVLYNQTTCSMNAYNRGMGQKIIGFSLYGDYNLRKL